jgi:hypothetical protein
MLVPAGTAAAANTPSSATKTVLAALQRTCAKRSERVAFSGRARTAGGDSFAFRGTGVVASSPARLRLVYRFRTSSGARWTMELRADSRSAYMKMPVLAHELPAGKSWVGLSRVEFRRQLGTAWTDLQTQLRSLQTGARAHKVGMQVVRGRHLTQYTLKGAAGRPIGLWIDGAGLVRRVAIGLDGRFETTVDYVAFGIPVHVSAPPRNRVVDFATFLAGERASRDAEAARRNVRNATVVVESWYAQHATYAGARPANVTIVSASRTSYCIESTVGRTTMHKAGPSAPVVVGHCRK